MHSSRMRTVRSSGRISGGSARGGVCCQGVSAPRGVGCLFRGRGVCSRREFGCLLWRMSARRVCLLWGGVYYQDGSAPREVCSGGCLLQGGCVSAPGGCLLSGESAPGGCLLWGVCVCSGGGVVSHHALRQTPPPPCGQTDACKNITFATSLRMVKTALTF